MRISIILCHYKTGKMTAFSIAQMLKYKGDHELDILICDNNSGDGSIEYLKPFSDSIRIFPYPKNKMQSHGIGYDFLIPHITTDWFITFESDSFPVSEGYIDFYEQLIKDGYEGAGSLLKLSGGTYIHPVGSLYKKDIWEEAKEYCNKIQYTYFPNMALYQGFSCHLMVHKSILDKFLDNPKMYVNLSSGYEGISKEEMILKANDYLPVVSPFHNGMGMIQESVKTYGQRTVESEVPYVLLDNKVELILRVGLEPGQWLCYYQAATGKKIGIIPTEVKWLPNRENQQQEYTLTDNGIKHLWGVSAYFDSNDPTRRDIEKEKQSLPEILYNSLPEHQKINHKKIVNDNY